jgi:hypothetical protein
MREKAGSSRLPFLAYLPLGILNLIHRILLIAVRSTQYLGISVSCSLSITGK